MFRSGRSLMVHHPVDEQKNRNPTLCWRRARGRLMENTLSDSSWSGIDCARGFGRWSEICDNFQTRRASDVGFCLCCAARDAHILFMALRLDLKASCKPLALIIALLMRAVTSQRCLMDTWNGGFVAFPRVQQFAAVPQQLT